MALLSRFSRVLGHARQPPPRLLGGLETLERLYERGQSVSRFGDGEMAMVFPRLWARDLHFQTADAALVARLRDLFRRPDPRVLCCYNNTFATHDEIPIVLDFERSKKSYAYFRTIHRKDDIGVLVGRAPTYRKWLNRVRSVYSTEVLGEAMCFFLCNYVEEYKNGSLEKVCAAYRRLMAGRRLLIVAPRRPLHGASFRDLADRRVIVSPREVDFIEIPERNCFSMYKDILDAILAAKRPDAVLVQAGPTATILAAELAIKFNITGYDVGSFNTSLEKANAVLGVQF